MPDKPIKPLTQAPVDPLTKAPNWIKNHKLIKLTPEQQRQGLTPPQAAARELARRIVEGEPVPPMLSPGEGLTLGELVAQDETLRKMTNLSGDAAAHEGAVERRIESGRTASPGSRESRRGFQLLREQHERGAQFVAPKEPRPEGEVRQEAIENAKERTRGILERIGENLIQAAVDKRRRRIGLNTGEFRAAQQAGLVESDLEIFQSAKRRAFDLESFLKEDPEIVKGKIRSAIDDRAAARMADSGMGMQDIAKRLFEGSEASANAAIERYRSRGEPVELVLHEQGLLYEGDRLGTTWKSWLPIFERRKIQKYMAEDVAANAEAMEKLKTGGGLTSEGAQLVFDDQRIRGIYSKYAPMLKDVESEIKGTIQDFFQKGRWEEVFAGGGTAGLGPVGARGPGGQPMPRGEPIILYPRGGERVLDPVLRDELGSGRDRAILEEVIGDFPKRRRLLVFRIAGTRAKVTVDPDLGPIVGLKPKPVELDPLDPKSENPPKRGDSPPVWYAGQLERPREWKAPSGNDYRRAEQGEISEQEKYEWAQAVSDVYWESRLPSEQEEVELARKTAILAKLRSQTPQETPKTFDVQREPPAMKAGPIGEMEFGTAFTKSGVPIMNPRTGEPKRRLQEAPPRFRPEIKEISDSDSRLEAARIRVSETGRQQEAKRERERSAFEDILVQSAGELGAPKIERIGGRATPLPVDLSLQALRERTLNQLEFIEAKVRRGQKLTDEERARAAGLMNGLRAIEEALKG